ncbi:hypothetical protein V2W45_162882 [Cenococcum geophilum]
MHKTFTDCYLAPGGGLTGGGWGYALNSNDFDGKKSERPMERVKYWTRTRGCLLCPRLGKCRDENLP